MTTPKKVTPAQEYDNIMSELKVLEKNSEEVRVYKSLLEKLEDLKEDVTLWGRDSLVNQGKGKIELFDGKYITVTGMNKNSSESWDALIFGIVWPEARTMGLIKVKAEEIDMKLAEAHAAINPLIKDALDKAYIPQQPQTAAISIQYKEDKEKPKKKSK